MRLAGQPQAQAGEELLGHARAERAEAQGQHARGALQRARHASPGWRAVAAARAARSPGARRRVSGGRRRHPACARAARAAELSAELRRDLRAALRGQIRARLACDLAGSGFPEPPLAVTARIRPVPRLGPDGDRDWRVYWAAFAVSCRPVFRFACKLARSLGLRSWILPWLLVVAPARAQSPVVDTFSPAPDQSGFS